MKPTGSSDPPITGTQGRWQETCCSSHAPYGLFPWPSHNPLVPAERKTVAISVYTFSRKCRGVKVRLQCVHLPARRSHAAHRQWQCSSRGTCNASATAPPTCPPLAAVSTALPASPGSPKGHKHMLEGCGIVQNCIKHVFGL